VGRGFVEPDAVGYVRMGWPEVAVNVLIWMHRSG
jgi:hypothetical protein